MSRIWDLLVIGGGPTGIAIGAEARRADIDALVVDRGPLTANLLDFPTYMTFFTTRDRLEVAGLPFTVPDAHPTRRQALAYYRAIAAHYRLELALHEEVVEATPEGDRFRVRSHRAGGAGRSERRARAVVLATGYFRTPLRLCVPGEELPWVGHRYRDPYRHFGERVVIVGGGNSAVEAALELWRAGVETTLVHRGEAVKESVKYWLRPDFENRILEGSIRALYRTRVQAFEDPGQILLDGPDGSTRLAADRALVLVGYRPDAELMRRCGVEVDPETLVPAVDAQTCESNVPGIYIAGTLQAGVDTNRIFIDNSREHAPRIVEHLRARLRRFEPVVD